MRSSFLASGLSAIGLLLGGERLQMPQNPAEYVFYVVDALLKKRRGQLLKGRHVLVERLNQRPLGARSGLKARAQVVLDGAVLQNHELCLQDRAVILAHES